MPADSSGTRRLFRPRQQLKGFLVVHPRRRNMNFDTVHALDNFECRLDDRQVLKAGKSILGSPKDSSLASYCVIIVFSSFGAR